VLSEKVFGGLIVDESHLHFWRVGKFRVAERPPRDTFVVVPGQRRWLPVALFNSRGTAQCALALDSAGHLVRWRSDRPNDCQLVASDIFGVAPTSGEKLVYAKFRDGALSLCIEQRDAGSTWTFPPALVSGRPVRLFALTEALRPQWRGHIRVVFAPKDDDTICRRYTSTGAKSLDEAVFRVGTKWDVVGLVRSDENTGAHALVLEAGRRRLAVLGSTGTEVIYEAGSEIHAVSCSPDGERVALLTLAGQLIVLGAGGRRTLMSVSGGELSTA
jgi:hypothetical protein